MGLSGAQKFGIFDLNKECFKEERFNDDSVILKR
jgi:hypothetical protein